MVPWIMAAVNYHAIVEGVKTLIDADPTNSDLVVHVEEELSVVEGPVVMVYLDRRDAPDEAQTLSGGQRTRYEVSVSVWCFGVSYDSMREAAQNRDKLLADVEVILMKDRTLDGSVESSWFTGGEFLSAESPGTTGFVSGAEISVVAFVVASTT